MMEGKVAGGRNTGETTREVDRVGRYRKHKYATGRTTKALAVAGEQLRLA